VKAKTFKLIYSFNVIQVYPLLEKKNPTSSGLSKVSKNALQKDFFLPKEGVALKQSV
jgi:hypothetical protein